MADKPPRRSSGPFREGTESLLDELASSEANAPTIDLLNQPAVDLLNTRVPDDVTRGWRRSLVDANAQILQKVSGSMPQTIAAGTAIRLPDLALEAADPTLRRIGDSPSSLTPSRRPSPS